MTKSPALGSVGRQAPGGDPRHDLTNPYCFDVGGQALQVFPRDPGRGLFLRRHFLFPAAGLFVVFAASQAIAGAGPSVGVRPIESAQCADLAEPICRVPKRLLY